MKARGWLRSEDWFEDVLLVVLTLLGLWILCEGQRFPSPSPLERVPLLPSLPEQAATFWHGPVRVRVTVYWRRGPGADRWTARGLSSTGVPLRSGHCAVDPAEVPYGTRLRVDGWGVFEAVDTGGAVKARKASAGMLPVVDVFFENRRDALRAARLKPENVLVEVVR